MEDSDDIELPARLYRVQYDKAMTTYDSETGLEAQDTSTSYIFKSKLSFGEALKKHLNWDRHYKSVFISLFSEKSDAEEWLLNMHRLSGCHNCMILEIDTAKVNADILNAQDIVEELGLELSRNAAESNNTLFNEWIAMHRIPADAILRTFTIDDVIRGKIGPSSFCKIILC